MTGLLNSRLRDKSGKETVALLILTLVHLILLRFPSLVPSHRLLFIFFFFYLVLVPGYLVSRIIFGKPALPVLSLFSLVFGTAHIFLLLFIFALFHLEIYYIGIVIPVLMLVALLIRRTGRVFPEHESLSSNLPGSTKSSQLVLLLLIVFVIVIINNYGAPLRYSSDAPDDLGYVKSVSLSREAFPREHLYKDGGTLTRDIRKGLGEAMWGTVNCMTGREEILTIWPIIASICSVFTIVALFCSALFIFGSPATGIIAALIFVLIQGGGLTQNGLLHTTSSFPTAEIYSLVFLFSVLGFMQSKRKEYLVLMAASSFAAGGIHAGHFIINLFMLFFLLGGKLIEGPSGERWRFIRGTTTLVLAITVCVNAPYYLLRYIRDYAPNSEIHTHLQGVFFITDKLYTINPVRFISHSLSLTLIGFLCIFILWKQSRNDENLRLLLWGKIAIWGLLFNPILVPPLVKTITYLAMRLKTAVPNSLLAAYLIKSLWDKLMGRKGAISKSGAVIGWAVVIVFFGYQLAVTPSRFAYSKEKGMGEEYSCLSISNLYREINESVPEGSVIVSDPLTSYCIQALTDQFIICPNDQHSVPNDSTAVDRIMVCRDIFSPHTPLEDIIGELNEYNAEFIVINGRIPSSSQTMYWTLDRETALETMMRFMEYPALFNTIYSHDDIAIFEITERARSGIVPITEELPGFEFVGEELTADELEGLAASGIPGILIKSVEPDNQRINRGEILTLDIEWIAARNCEPKRYLSILRFDADHYKGALFHEAYSKIYRKVIEQSRGHKFRFRVSHQPFNGIFSPDKWPPRRVIKDRVTAKIPEDISPGTYEISIKLLERIQYPNYTLKDYLSNDDIYNGEVVGRVIVE